VSAGQELTQERTNLLKQGLRNYRARELLVKDLEDIGRDLRDEDPTAALRIVEQFEEQKSIEILEDIYQEFDYSSGEGYTNVLEDMQPDKDLIQTKIGEVPQGLLY